MKQVAAYLLPHILIVALFLAFCLWAHFYAEASPEENAPEYFSASASLELRLRNR